MSWFLGFYAVLAVHGPSFFFQAESEEDDDVDSSDTAEGISCGAVEDEDMSDEDTMDVPQVIAQVCN